MSRLNEIERRYPLPTLRPLAWSIMALLALLLGWAYFAELDEVAIAEGEVVPQGQIKVVQHLEGGIVEQLYVTEGTPVSVGDPLVRLDLGTTGGKREELQIQLDALLLRRARLQAEAAGRDSVSFPDAPAKRRPAIVATETRLFTARRAELESTLQVLRQQVRQRELEVQELQAQRRKVEANLRTTNERFKLSTALLADGLTPKMEHLGLQAEVEDLQGQIDVLASAIPRAGSALAEAKERVRELSTKFGREADDELGKVEVSIARTAEGLSEATDQFRRTTIRSPIDGVVQNLSFVTIGGVIRPGEPILEIVPSREKLIVEARLNPVDRGYVEQGQAAVVKISTYDFVRYGGLDGRVILVAPDASTGPDGQPYFRVLVETDKTWLGERRGLLPISPGMQAIVDIHTGRKSVMDYLVKPVLKLRHEAFRER